MNFTIHNDPSMDLQIENQLNKIGQDISQLLPVRALILYGAFGRGEGRIEKDANNFRIINDLDIIAVTEGDLADLKLPWKEVQTKLQKDSSTFIDIKPISYNLLPRLSFTMDNFDLKYGGYVFWGDDSVLDIIPDYETSKMPRIQGRRLLLNRLITFLEARGDLNKEIPKGTRSAFCNYQSSKIVMACIDAYLVETGTFTTKYQNKYKQFKDISSLKEFHDLGEEALAIKVGPGRIRTENPIFFWERAGEFFFKTVNDFLSEEKDFKLSIFGKGLLKNIYKKKPKNHVKYFIKYLLRRNCTARQYLETINLLILFSLFGGIDHTPTISKLLCEYGKRFHIPIQAQELCNLKDIYPIALQFWYEKLHLGIPTYELWKK